MRGSGSSFLVLFVALVLISWALPSYAVTYTCPKFNPTQRACNNIHSGKSRSDYVPTSNPMYIAKDTCHITDLPSDLQSTVNTLFPEGAHPDPAMIKPLLFAYVTKPNTNISFTFVSTGAGYMNRLGYAKFNSVTNQIIGSVYPVFPLINTNNGVGCLQQGDTYKFGQFTTNDVVIFYLDADSIEADRFWSYVSVDFPNPDTEACSCNTGFIHGSWAYLQQDDIALFGFEDLKLGDADYNDAMFFLTYEGGVKYNDIETYENKTLKICNPNTTIADRSFAIISCTVYGILEAVQSQSCLTYMSVPVGYTLARDDDPDAKEAIRSLARTQWAYTGASCFLLSTGPTSVVGYDPDLVECPPYEYSLNWLYNTTSKLYCYNTVCSARFVLKGANLGTSCGSTAVCSPATIGTALAYDPPAAGTTLQYPKEASIFLKAPGGSFNVPLSVALNTQTTKKQMDLIVFLDLTTIPTNQVDSLITELNNFWTNLDTSPSVDLKLTLALTYNGVPTTVDYSFYSYSTSNFNTFADRIRLMAPTAKSAVCSNSATQTKLGYVLRQSFPWRPDAYKAMYIASVCPTTTDLAFQNAVFASGVRTYFFASTNSMPSGWLANQAYSPIGFKSSNSGNNWRSGLATNQEMIKNWPNDVLLYTASDNNGFIPTIVPTYTVLPDIGYYSTEIPVVWPNGLVPPQSVSNFYSSIRFLGRNLLGIKINFNHKPVVSSVSLTANGGQRIELKFQASDPDANILTLTILSYPSFGSLYLADGTLIPSSPAYTLPKGILSVYYEAAKLASGTVSFSVRVSDGCATTDTTGTVIVTPTNTPPVAQNFVITLYEDSLWNNPTTNGLIDFGPRVSDDDESTQTLTVSLMSLPGTTMGTLRTYSTANSGTAFSSNSVVGTKQASTAKARYVLKTPPSSWGTVTFNYRVFDGLVYSNSATVTINVVHVNHPPVLSVPVTNFQVLYSTNNFPILATISDADGVKTASEKVNLKVVSANLGPYHLNDAGDTNTVSFAQADTVPKNLFTNPWGPTPAQSSIFPVTLFSWNLGTYVSGSPYFVGSVVIQAFDDTGAGSNQVTLTFNVTSYSPPTWFSKPASSYNINQGDTSADLSYRATDMDGTEWRDLIFNLTTPIPTGHAISLVSGANSLQIPTGTNFRQTTHGTYVSLTAADSTSNFVIRYTPPATYYGTFTFSFTVRDVTGLYANQPATVTINVIRRLDPPVSADCTISGLQETLTSSLLTAYSQNDIANNEVLLRMVSQNFVGKIFVNTPTNIWSINADSSLVKNSASINVWVQGDYGIYSPNMNTPIGNFTFVPVEPSAPANNTGAIYTCQIYLDHVNKPPTSRDESYPGLPKRTPLKIVLSATDPDVDDPPATISAVIKTISGKGTFYLDEALTQVLDPALLGNGVNITMARTLWYRSMDDVSVNGRPLATFTFIVVDKQGMPSVRTYTGNIFVTWAGDPPRAGNLEREVIQENPLTMALKESLWTEGPLGADATILTLPTRGTLSVCDANGICIIHTSVPPGGIPVTSAMANVIFLPRAYDWDRNFTSFNFLLTDIASGATGTFTMYIHVIHRNKPPTIRAANFGATPLVMNESSSIAISWLAFDVDSMPAELTTIIRASFYTSQGFTMYACTGTAADWLSTSACTFDPAVPFAVRADLIKYAPRTIGNYETVTTSCPTFTALRAKMGANDSDCESHFKLNFVPTPLASYTPYVTISLTADDNYADGLDTKSTTITTTIIVKAINSPPTITAPPLVLAASGTTNPFIRDTDQNSANFNVPVVVSDIDSNGNKEFLTISVDDNYSGNLQYPASAPCTADPNGRAWYCLDRISGFNQWLKDLRFEVTSGDRADISFEINDLGFTSDYKPSKNLTAVAHSTIKIIPAVAAPKGNSQTLAIAVGVAAAAGLLLLGALGFFLRKAVAPPADDYFAAATTPLSAAPQSPLYQAQNTTHESALYKGM